MKNQLINKKDLFYPSAIDWMWDYCIWLGKFTDSKGNNYDLGIHINEGVYQGKKYRDIKAAIVNGNIPGDYYSGDIVPDKHGEDPSFDWYYEKYRETYNRAKEKGFIK